MPAKGEKYFFISSLAKGIKVLELLAEHQALTVSEVAKRLGYHQPAAHRFLATLRELGYAEKDEKGRYQLSFRFIEIGMKVANRSEIHRMARSYMQELSVAFNETVNLGHFDGLDIFHLDKIDSKEILRMDSPLGSKAPAYCTALGKAILAFLPSDELDDYLAGTKLKVNGPNTITNKKKFLKELEETRKRGFAIDNEEMASGLRCVAAPLFNHSGRSDYAISVSGPSVRMTTKRLRSIHPKVLEVCNRLSQRLGSYPPADR
jgi:DNA-binding IclR family transcriptional regulator